MNNKSGLGVGSASIVLIFAVLCLTVFSLITFVVAANDKALVDTEAELVISYYKADAQAERILAVILTSDVIPEAVEGVEIETQWGYDAELAQYLCPISDKKALLVRLMLYEDSYDILCWRMYDTAEWAFDDSLNVWTGFDEFEFDDHMDVWLGFDEWDTDDD